MTTKNKSAWKPISSAPKDGTMILVTETPNGEHWNIVPACWMAYTTQYELDKQRIKNFDYKLLPDNSHKGRWWGVCQVRSSDEGPLYTRFKPLAITPVCWMPFPKMETIEKLNRRFSHIKL